MSRLVRVAASQMACSWNVDENIANAESLVREAAGKGANIILLQELFETPYFCIAQDPAHYKLAAPFAQHKGLTHLQTVARELEVVLPLSYYERDGNALFNSLVVVDADGEIVSHYRKSHIPQNPGYEEKFYFSPGDTGFEVSQTRFGKVGVGICWDQWFPEAARIMALQGAEILFYPTAIGSEPSMPEYDSSDHWQTVMRGHAGANLVPVVASNRIGREVMTDIGVEKAITFYGRSFITDNKGAKLSEMGRDEKGVIVAELDLEVFAHERIMWGVFRDRRPDLYGPICGY